MGRAEAVLFSVTASCFTSSGLCIQKHSHNMGEMSRPALERWRWMIGLIMILLGGVFDSLALGSGPLSGIAPLSGITILLNSVLAAFFLGERIRLVDLVATLIIFSGATLTSVFCAKPVPYHGVEELFDLFGHQSFTIYLSIVVMLIFLCMLLLRASSGTSLESGMAPFAWGIVAAGLGGVEVLLLKCMMEVLATHVLDGVNQFDSPDAYILFLVFGAVAFFQLYALNLGLSVCDAVRMLPVYQSVFIINALCGGAAYFNEFHAFTKEQWTYFPLGVGLVLIGTSMLTFCAPDRAAERNDAAEVEMQTGDAKDEPLLQQA